MSDGGNIIRLSFCVLGHSVLEKITAQNAGFHVLDGVLWEAGHAGLCPVSARQSTCLEK